MLDHRSGPARPRVVIAALIVGAALCAISGPSTAAATLPNHDFESGSLAGWTIASGTAFSSASVTRSASFAGQTPKFFPEGPYRQQGTFHVTSRNPDDNATGVLESAPFTIEAPTINFLVAGGYRPDRVYVALVRTSDGQELLRQTPASDDSYVCVTWDVSQYRGTDVVIRVVDTARGGIEPLLGAGHINIDDVNVDGEPCAGVRGVTAFTVPPATPADDPWRPRYHFSPQHGWLNDPVGLIRWHGEYHLFYQYHPGAPVWDTMSWGHAVSRDLVHWSDVPVALSPELRPTPDLTGLGGVSPMPPELLRDHSGVWSGSAVDDHGTLTLVYTRFNWPAAWPERPLETQNIATSTDGRTFRPCTCNPVIGHAPRGSSAAFRDPKVFKDADGRWKMLLGSGHYGGARVRIYSSADLRTWRDEGVLFERGTATPPAGDISPVGDSARFVLDGVLPAGSLPTNITYFETPDLFRLGDTWVLLVSAGVTTYWFTGDYERNRFVAHHGGRLDLGPDVYAAQTLLDEHGRRIAIGWMDTWNGAFPSQLNGWAGAMTLPRVLTVGKDGQLRTGPLPQIRALRGDRVRTGRLRVMAGRPDPLPERARGDAVELAVDFDVRRSSARAFGVRLRRSSADVTVLRYSRLSRRLTLDRTHSGYGRAGVFGGEVTPTASGRLRLRLFIDRSSVEVFANDGKASITNRVYPRYHEDIGIDLFSEHGTAWVASASMWTLAAGRSPAGGG